MTYEEALKNNIEKINSEGTMIRTMVLPYFLNSFALLSCMIADSLCRQDFPTASIGKEKLEGGGKGEPVPSLFSVLRVLSHNDVFRSIDLMQSLIRFLDWLLEQEISEDLIDDGDMWYDYGCILNKWNEFVKIKNDKLY